MGEQAPRVSIGLPVYNGEEFLEEAVDSLLSQTYRDFELIISDNASTDRTEEICRRYAAQDRRVRYSRNAENIGGNNNANLTFGLARGEYFRFAAHDDRCAPTMLEKLVEELDRRPEMAACYGAIVSIDAHGNETGVRYATEGTAARPHERFRQLAGADWQKLGADQQYGLIRSDVLRRTQLLKNYTGADLVLLCELALRGPFHLVPEPLFFKRYHEGNVYTDWRGRMAWFHPDLSESGTPTFPNWLKIADYARTLARVPMPWSERALCALTLGRWTARKWRGPAGDVVDAARMLLHSKAWRTSRYAPERWR